MAWDDQANPTTLVAQAQDLYDCYKGQFTCQEEAQAILDQDPGDPYGLDGPIGEASDGVPGVACEDLPHRPNNQLVGAGGPTNGSVP